jgi:hypothetical protein
MNVNADCPIVEPKFTRNFIQQEMPEINVIDSNDIPLLPISFKDAVGIKAARREIPYMIATEYRNGHYNTTFTWQSIERVLRSIERFKLVKYKRVMSGARLTFLQTNRDLGRGIAAVATKSKGLIRINPTFNFTYSLAYCDRVCFHENFHLTGSSNHTNFGDPRPLMHAYGGTLDTLLPIDETYISVYPWVGAERFSTTPNLLSQLLSNERVVCGIERSWRDRLVFP